MQHYEMLTLGRSSPCTVPRKHLPEVTAHKGILCTVVRYTMAIETLISRTGATHSKPQQTASA